MAKKYLIIGAGAVGTFYGSKLSQAGDQIIIWSRNDSEIIAKNGYKIKSYMGDYDFNPYLVIKNLHDLREDIDFIIVSTKVLPDIDIVDLISKVIKKNIAIIIIQNGIHIEKNIADKFSSNQIISALAFIGVSRTNPNEINHQEYGKLIFGNYNNIDSIAINYFAKSLEKSGLEILLSSNILSERWKKLIWNGAFNPLSVVLGKKNTQQILENNLAIDLAKNIMQEIVMLAKHDGCKFENDIIDKNILATKKMLPYKTSMLLDFEANRPMEIQAIIGNAVKFAQSKSLSIPYLSTIYAIISNL